MQSFHRPFSVAQNYNTAQCNHFIIVFDNWHLACFWFVRVLIFAQIFWFVHFFYFARDYILRRFSVLHIFKFAQILNFAQFVFMFCLVLVLEWYQPCPLSQDNSTAQYNHFIDHSLLRKTITPHNAIISSSFLILDIWLAFALFRF